MKKGGILLVTAAVMACTACLGDSGKLEIRTVKNGLKAGPEPVPYRIAEARGHLALGNVGLALEGFRKAARDDPSSIEALAGIAGCYDRMGRFDLSRRHYERALALAPRNTGLLAAFAGSLDRQGKNREAMAVRQELAAPSEAQVEIATAEIPVATEQKAEPVAAARAEPVAAATAEPVAVTTAEAAPPPLAAPAPVGRSVTIVLPPPRPFEAPKAEPVAVTAARAAPPPPRPFEAPKAKPAAPQAMAVAPVGQSVTIALPPPRPAPSAKPLAPVAVAKTAVHRQPRIERLSLTEVALFTTDGPRWKKPAPQPVRMAALKPGKVRILNAARVDRLAARTRAYLGRFGWRQVMIGDAARTRSHSIILYPVGGRGEAIRLSSRFGFAMAPRDDIRQLTILLGRDAASIPALQRKS